MPLSDAQVPLFEAQVPLSEAQVPLSEAQVPLLIYAVPRHILLKNLGSEAHSRVPTPCTTLHYTTLQCTALHYQAYTRFLVFSFFSVETHKFYKNVTKFSCFVFKHLKNYAK